MLAAARTCPAISVSPSTEASEACRRPATGARWYLDDLASAVRLFRQPHSGTVDAERWFDGLAPRLARLPEWLGQLG